MTIKTIITVLSVVLLYSCQSSTNRFTEDTRGANAYSSTEIGRLSSVSEGIIVAIKSVKISGSKALGAGLGAALGSSVASNSVGGEGDKVPASIVGGLLGALAGKAIEENVTAETGFEFLVKFANGQIKSFTQKSKQGFRVGDQVYVIHGGQTVRLTRK